MIDILDLVDGGNQQGDGRAGIGVEFCGRSHRTKGAAYAAPGFSFCKPCLLWLRCESDVDPCDDGEEVAALQQTPPEMWAGYVEMLNGLQSQL